MSAQRPGQQQPSASASTALAAVLVCGVWLAACQRTESVPPTSRPDATATAQPGTAAAGIPAVPASGADNSVPDAGRVLAGQSPAPGPASGGPAENQRNAMTKEQESKAMPLPGQANDHSNTAADKASAPKPR